MYRWFRNFTQFGDQESGSREALADIPAPFTELGFHVTFKTAETGAVIGGTLAKPAHYLYHKKWLQNPAKPLKVWKAARKFSVYPLLAGIASGPLLAFIYCKALKITEQEARERCYRLRYNRKQLHIDRSAVTLSAIGALWGPHGIVTWMNIGILYSIFYNTFLWSRTTRLATDWDEEMPEGTHRMFLKEAEDSKQPDYLERKKPPSIIGTIVNI